MSTLHSPCDEPAVERFLADGFVVFERMFADNQVAAIEAGFDRIEATAASLVASGKLFDTPSPRVEYGGSTFNFAKSDDGAWHVKHIAWCGGIDAALSDWGEHPRLLAAAAALLGSSTMDHLINQAHFKRPGSGVAFPWHQDATHRGMQAGHFVDLNGRGSFVQFALAIDDMTEDNGPLRFIPGSWRQGHLPAGQAYGGISTELFDVDAAVTPLLRRGDVAAFGPYTIHGSEPNLSDQPRRVFINGFATPGANRRDYAGAGAGRRIVAPG